MKKLFQKNSETVNLNRRSFMIGTASAGLVMQKNQLRNKLFHPPFGGL